MTVAFKLSCVLFDLDGTLVDTAPDLVAALNKTLLKHGFDDVCMNAIKPYISYGAAAMISNTLQDDYNEQLKTVLLEDMLNSYQDNIAEQTQLFRGMASILDSIETKGLKWGVITNKRERFTHPLMDALQLTHRAACIVSGDTTEFSKPHPEPMFTACKFANVKPHECLYIGDAAHDIEAGKRADMKTLAAIYGYLKPGDQPAQWGADALIEKPSDISDWIIKHTCH